MMNQQKELTLITGVRLLIHRDSLLCYAPDDSEIILTRGQELLLKKLADDAGCAVSMSELYEAYSGDAPSLGDTGIRDNIAKMKNTLPDGIKRSIKSVRGYGYKLMTDQHPPACLNEVQADTAGEAEYPAGLAGNYYGFFLDPVGNGSVLGAYFHLEKANRNSLSVSAILGIRDSKMLFSRDLADIFSSAQADYHRNFKEFIRRHSVNNKRCFWAEGDLQCHNAVAELRLKTPIDARWNIWFDLSRFSERVRQESSYTYKGGLGFAVAVTPSYGTFCCKLGLVRTSYLAKPQKRYDPELQNMLLLSGINDFSPLMLDIQKDRYWYNWFLSE